MDVNSNTPMEEIRSMLVVLNLSMVYKSFVLKIVVSKSLSQNKNIIKEKKLGILDFRPRVSTTEVKYWT